jgi:alanine racemase
VELWGENVKVDEVAEPSGTIGYELMCAVARRVPVEVDGLATVQREAEEGVAA